MIEDKEIKEKIMQIVENHWFEDGSIQLVEIADEIITLIQEERKDAVEGFVDNIGWKKPSEVIDLADDVIDGRSLVKQMEAYLQSLDKGGE